MINKIAYAIQRTRMQFSTHIKKESQLNIKCLQISRYIMLYIVEHFNLFISGIKYTKKCHDTDMQQIILIHNRSHANH